jgi:UDP-N-acetylmuramoylalanine--D-glutamate ligase
MNFGIGHQSILEGIKSFKNAPHRMEHVTAIKGIDFVNDSKATNVDSAYYALGSYPAIVWIAGGKDKGNNYDQLREFAREKVKALVCLGKDNSKLLNYFRGVVPSISDTHTIKDAVRKAFSLAQKGNTVLLSPACASFDLFKNYEDRGDQFRNEVLELKKELEKENNRVL